MSFFWEQLFVFVAQVEVFVDHCGKVGESSQIDNREELKDGDGPSARNAPPINHVFEDVLFCAVVRSACEEFSLNVDEQENLNQPCNDHGP